MNINLPSSHSIKLEDAEPNEFVQLEDNKVALVLCDGGNSHRCAKGYIAIYVINGDGLNQIHKNTLCVPLQTEINFNYKESK